MTISFDDFLKGDMRVGRILEVAPFPEARKPAWKLTIDFGPEIGTKQSSAQITALYAEQDLLERLIVAVVNFPPKHIAGFRSEVLVLGVEDREGRIVLLQPDRDAPVGSRVH
jgi:tRNA-binding protein